MSWIDILQIFLTNLLKQCQKPKTLPSIQTPVSAEHLLFNFYFIPNCPNYITKLNCPTKNSAWKFNAPPNSPSSKLSKIIYQSETKTKTTTQKLQTPNPNSHLASHQEKTHPLHSSATLPQPTQTPPLPQPHKPHKFTDLTDTPLLSMT